MKLGKWLVICGTLFLLSACSLVELRKGISLHESEDLGWRCSAPPYSDLGFGFVACTRMGRYAVMFRDPVHKFTIHVRTESDSVRNISFGPAPVIPLPIFFSPFGIADAVRSRRHESLTAPIRLSITYHGEAKQSFFAREPSLILPSGEAVEGSWSVYENGTAKVTPLSPQKIPYTLRMDGSVEGTVTAVLVISDLPRNTSCMKVDLGEIYMGNETISCPIFEIEKGSGLSLAWTYILL